MKKILIVLTNKPGLEGYSKQTGFWFNELVHFYTIVKIQGFDVDIASPLGGEAPIDELSANGIFLDKEARAYYESEKFMMLVKNTKSLDEIKPRNYSGVYLVGGLGVFGDFYENMRLNEVLLKIFKNNGVIATIGFGALAILNLKWNDVHIIERKQITCMSMQEELILGIRKKMPISLEKVVKERNAFYSKAFFPLTSYVIKDGRIITGENMNSARTVAWQMALSLKSFMV